MNAHRMDQETAERLLGGPVGDPGTGQEPIVALLSAVRAAPGPSELRGEGAAVHAFRRAMAGTPVPVPAAASGPGLLVRLAGLKVALAAAAVAATGGVALAAATGTLPGTPLREADRPGRPSAAAPDRSTSPTDRPRPTTPATAAPATPDDPRATEPSPSTVALCRAYRARVGDGPGGALDSPAFADLVRQAGRPEAVAGYCERALAASGRPTGPDSGPPGSPGADRPAKPPAGRPTPTAGPGSAGPPAASKTPAAPSTPAAPDTPGLPGASADRGAGVTGRPTGH